MRISDWSSDVCSSDLTLTAAVIVAAAEVAATTTATATAVEQHHFAPEALQHDLGRILVLALLVGPFAGLELAFQIDLRSFAQILLGDAAQIFIEDHDPVPFGALLPLAGLVLPRLEIGRAHV